MKTMAPLHRAQSETAEHVIGRRSSMLRAAAFRSARIVLGGVFLLSGMSKLHSPGTASWFLSGILSLSPQAAQAATTVLSGIEIALGSLLLLNRWVGRVALVSSVFLLASTFVAVVFASEPRSCGCFGALFDSRTDAFLLERNFGLLILSVLILKASTRRHEEESGT